MRDFTRKPQTLLNAKAGTGSDLTGGIFVGDWRHIIIYIASASSANLTVKFQGSISESAPDFTAAQSVSNVWDYVQIKDLEDASAVDGDTGIAFAGTDDVRMFEVNVNGLQWFNANVTARAAGSVTVKLVGFAD